MFNNSSFRVVPYLISQYLFFFIIVFGFGISSQSTSKHIADERYCSASNGSNFNDQYDPDYFYHLTDVHVTHYDKNTQDVFEKSLEIGSSYKSKSVLITGDLVDNYYLPYSNNDAQETKQMREDWEEYHKVASKFTNKFEKIIESFGNHDIPRILSHDSHNFFYNKYSMIANSHHNFSLPNDTYDVFTEKIGNFTFLVLNPIFFPIPPLPFTYYVHAPTQYIDKVERIIDTIPDDANVILATHFQGPVWSESYCPFVKSASTERFFRSILQNRKVKILLTGHNHGSGRMVMHHGDSFEVCASDLRENLRSGFVTNDNGNIVYHWFTIDKPTKTFVTFPSPVDQTTSRTDCSVSKVRAISFQEGEKFVEIDGKRFKLNRIRKLNKNNDAWLLEANLSFLSRGRHHLKLIGEDEEEFEFIFGSSEKIEAKTELLYDDMLWAHNQWIGLIILIVMFIVVTFPISIISGCSFDGYWKWINKIDDEQQNKDDQDKLLKQKNDNASQEKLMKRNAENSDRMCGNFSDDDIKYYLFTFFVGFLGIRSRLLKLPLTIRFLLFASVILSLFLPIFTFDVDGTYGFMFMFGYYLSHEDGNTIIKYSDSSKGDHYISRLYHALDLRYEVWCPFLGFYYFSIAVIPVILAASSLGLKPINERESKIQLIDFAVEIGAIIGGIIICFDSFLLLCERKCALLSPFIQFPLFWLSIFSLVFINRKKKRNIGF